MSISIASVMAIITKIKAGIDIAKAAVEIGKDVKPFLDALLDKDVTQADIDALDARLAELEARAFAQLPPAEPGEAP